MTNATKCTTVTEIRLTVTALWAVVFECEAAYAVVSRSSATARERRFAAAYLRAAPAAVAETQAQVWAAIEAAQTGFEVPALEGAMATTLREWSLPAGRFAPPATVEARALVRLVVQRAAFASQLLAVLEHRLVIDVAAEAA